MTKRRQFLSGLAILSTGCLSRSEGSEQLQQGNDTQDERDETRTEELPTETEAKTQNTSKKPTESERGDIRKLDESDIEGGGRLEDRYPDSKLAEQDDSDEIAEFEGPEPPIAKKENRRERDANRPPQPVPKNLDELPRREPRIRERDKETGDDDAPQQPYSETGEDDRERRRENWQWRRRRRRQR